MPGRPSPATAASPLAVAGSVTDWQTNGPRTREPRPLVRQFANFAKRACLRQGHRGRVERARGSSATRRQMAPNHRYPTAAAPGKARSPLEQQTPALRPFFCPWSRFSPRLVGGWLPSCESDFEGQWLAYPLAGGPPQYDKRLIYLAFPLRIVNQPRHGWISGCTHSAPEI
jgi:hypothetical protein